MTAVVQGTIDSANRIRRSLDSDHGAPETGRHFLRYHRQVILPGFGEQAQERLRSAHALVVGCGALGCAAIDLLARAGVGTITIVDRDVVELTNLQRQCLFTERDAREGVPKAEAAKRRVADVNREVRVHACVEHLGADNAVEFVRDCTVVVDGLDNYRTRYVLNDASVQVGRPFVHAGAVGMMGTSAPFLAGVADAWGLARADAPCLRCVFPTLPAPGEGETCDTAGVFGPLVATVGAHAADAAIKIAAGLHAAVDRSLWHIDAAANRELRVSLAGTARADCPCCGARKFEFLRAEDDDQATVLCGRNAVQVKPGAHAGVGARARAQPGSADAGIDLAALAVRLRTHGDFAMRGAQLVGTLREIRARDGAAVELTVFADGRAIVRGSTDATFAKSVYDRLIGS
ncbi:MAG: ThiF family adenylyltransferase [Phycisphaerae bacterium]|nr:ThiF family adenylyltransferase [Phycisphaerae bacterium]